MQKSYEAEFDGLKAFILKSNRRHRQQLKNSEKLLHQKLREKDREVRYTLAENAQLKGIVKNKDIDVKELKEEILTMDKELKKVGAGRYSERLNLPSPSKKKKRSRRLRELEELSSNVIFQSLNE